MHAKLEDFGLATMLKIIFTSSIEELKKSMSRNELAAFINLFAKLLKSVNILELIDKKIKKGHHNLKFKKIKCICKVSIIVIIITIMLLNFVNSSNNLDNINDDNKKRINKKEGKKRKLMFKSLSIDLL